jgi:hypothetical protein
MNLSYVLKFNIMQIYVDVLKIYILSIKIEGLMRRKLREESIFAK